MVYVLLQLLPIGTCCARWNVQLSAALQPMIQATFPRGASFPSRFSFKTKTVTPCHETLCCDELALFRHRLLMNAAGNTIAVLLLLISVYLWMIAM